MFESLTQRLSGTIERVRGRGRLTESNISEAVREVRIALLEADVALPVVQALIAAHGACPPSQRRSDPQLQLLRGVRIDFLPGGMTRNAYLEHPRFHIQRERAR